MDGIKTSYKRKALVKKKIKPSALFKGVIVGIYILTFASETLLNLYNVGVIFCIYICSMKVTPMYVEKRLRTN